MLLHLRLHERVLLLESGLAHASPEQVLIAGVLSTQLGRVARQVGRARVAALLP